MRPRERTPFPLRALAGDAALVGRGIRIDGVSGRDLYAAGESIDLRGQVGRTVTTHGQRLAVHDSARIGRDLNIQVPEDGEADVESGAQIGGDVSETLIESDFDEDRSVWFEGGFYLRAFVYIISAFLVGLALHALVPGMALQTHLNAC